MVKRGWRRSGGRREASGRAVESAIVELLRAVVRAVEASERGYVQYDERCRRSIVCGALCVMSANTSRCRASVRVSAGGGDCGCQIALFRHRGTCVASLVSRSARRHPESCHCSDYRQGREIARSVERCFVACLLPSCPSRRSSWSSRAWTLVSERTITKEGRSKGTEKRWKLLRRPGCYRDQAADHCCFAPLLRRFLLFESPILTAHTDILATHCAPLTITTVVPINVGRHKGSPSSPTTLPITTGQP